MQVRFGPRRNSHTGAVIRIRDLGVDVAGGSNSFFGAWAARFGAWPAMLGAWAARFGAWPAMLGAWAARFGARAATFGARGGQVRCVAG
jgi:hypothetical protein